MPDLRNLETFVWVARLGGFRLAAEKLNTTQPAISARVAALEQEFGVRLFERKQRRATLTVKGLELLGYAEQMLQLRTDMVRSIGAPASLRGLLRLGAPETIGHTWLSILVKRIHATYPSVTLEIQIDSTPDLRKALVGGDLDIAFLLGPVSEPRITSTPLCSYPVAWLASPRLDLPARRLSLSELIRWPIISSRPGAPHTVAIKALLANAKIPLARLYTSSSIATIVRMTLDGIGVGVVPAIVAWRELAGRSLRLVETEHQLPDVDFSVSYPQKPDSYLAATVADIALEIARGYGADAPPS
jgi:DNA-binding transcriptional LysR family regulator